MLLQRPAQAAAAEDIDRIFVASRCTNDNGISVDRHGLSKRCGRSRISDRRAAGQLGRLELGLLRPRPARNGLHKHVDRPGVGGTAVIERCTDDHRVAGDGHRTAEAAAATQSPVARVELCLLDPLAATPLVDDYGAVRNAAREVGPDDECGAADRHRPAEVPRIDRFVHRQFRLLTPVDRAVDRDGLEHEVL